MPELPEVETTLKGLQPYLQNAIIETVQVRESRLRWPVPSELAPQLRNQKVMALSRRGKYLLLAFNQGTLIIHLGMSGRLSLLERATVPQKHDHVDFHFDNGVILRYTDPRRFGAILWTTQPVHSHPLLSHLGLEPLSAEFTGSYLWEKAQQRAIPIKTLLMNHTVVVGIGNIYAAEALFLAGISPLRPAKAVTKREMTRLVRCCKQVLTAAISQGGTSFRDFLNSAGKPGYFSVSLNVYGKQGKICPRCQEKLLAVRINQRATCYCQYCQV